MHRDRFTFWEYTSSGARGSVGGSLTLTSTHSWCRGELSSRSAGSMTFGAAHDGLWGTTRPVPTSSRWLSMIRFAR